MRVLRNAGTYPGIGKRHPLSCILECHECYECVFLALGGLPTGMMTPLFVSPPTFTPYPIQWWCYNDPETGKQRDVPMDATLSGGDAPATAEIFLKWVFEDECKGYEVRSFFCFWGHALGGARARARQGALALAHAHARASDSCPLLTIVCPSSPLYNPY